MDWVMAWVKFNCINPSLVYL